MQYSEEPTVYQKTVSQLNSVSLERGLGEVTESELPGNEVKALGKEVTKAENEGLAENLYESMDEDENNENLNNSLDIVTEYYNNIILENTKYLSTQAPESNNEAVTEANHEAGETLSLDDETPEISVVCEESIDGISSVDESLNSSLDIATKYYNNIILRNYELGKLDFNSKVVGTQPPQTEPNNEETLLSRYKNVIGGDEPVKEQENGLKLKMKSCCLQ